jgi:hypothetical protein
MPELAAPPEQAASATEEPARAPGQMERHYAPRARLIAFDGDGAAATRAVAEAVRVAVASGARVGALVSEEEAPALDGLGARVFALGPAGDLAAIARNLYARLRELDDASVALIVTHTFAGEGLGLALRDRLRRAAGGQLTPLPPVLWRSDIPAIPTGQLRHRMGAAPAGERSGHWLSARYHRRRQGQRSAVTYTARRRP